MHNRLERTTPSEDSIDVQRAVNGDMEAFERLYRRHLNRMHYFGHDLGPFTISIRNGYLYFGDQRCLEYEPGLFFVYDRSVLDFRKETPA